MPVGALIHHRRLTALCGGLYSRRRAAASSIDLVTPSLQAGGHGAVIVVASRIGIAGVSAARLRRVESGLSFGPIVTFELVGSLLLLGLTTLRVNHQVVRCARP